MLLGNSVLWEALVPVPVATTNLVACRHFACLAWHDNYLSEKSTCKTIDSVNYSRVDEKADKTMAISQWYGGHSEHMKWCKRFVEEV